MSRVGTLGVGNTLREAASNTKSWSETIKFHNFISSLAGKSAKGKYILQLIGEYAEKAPICDPIKNPPVFLGLELERNFDKRIILVRVSKKIEEMCAKHLTPRGRTRNVPMPTSYYVVRDEDLDQLSETKRRFLEPAEITAYMSIIGGFIWIQGVRHDIVFTVLYLSWFLKKPRQHHMECASYGMCIIWDVWAISKVQKTYPWFLVVAKT